MTISKTTESGGMKNIINKKTVQSTEWIKSDTVRITYTDGSKETMSRKSFEQIIKGRVMSRLEQELGEGYQQVLLGYLGREHVVNHGYAPTWWITCSKDTNWKGKSYWVRKALNQLQKDGKVESFKSRTGSVGWCWALAGKMRKG